MLTIMCTIILFQPTFSRHGVELFCAVDCTTAAHAALPVSHCDCHARAGGLCRSCTGEYLIY